MKKIIAIAVAGAFAAPVFAAEITLGGDVEYYFSESDGANAAVVSDVDINVDFTEDLGNGLTVSGYVEGADDNTGDLVSLVSVSGDFGAVTTGDDGDHAGNAYDDVTDVAPFGMGDGVGTSGTMVNNVLLEPNLGVAGLTLGLGYSAGAAGVGEMSSYGVKYEFGSMSVRVGATDEDGVSDSASHISATYSGNGIYAAYEVIENQSGTTDNELTKYAFTYTMGDIKAFFEVQEAQASSTATEYAETGYGAYYTVGGGLKLYAEAHTQESASPDVDTTVLGMTYAF